MAILTEEVGEVSRAVRVNEIGCDHHGERPVISAEKRANLKEKADTLDLVLVLSSLYDTCLRPVRRNSRHDLRVGNRPSPDYL